MGEAVEKRLKKMREDTLWIVRPYKSARDAHHVGQTPAEAAERENSQVPGSDLPETIIGSRTAALMFVDPRMMKRKTVPHTVGEPLPGAASERFD